MKIGVLLLSSGSQVNILQIGVHHLFQCYSRLNSAFPYDMYKNFNSIANHCLRFTNMFLRCTNMFLVCIFLKKDFTVSLLVFKPGRIEDSRWFILMISVIKPKEKLVHREYSHFSLNAAKGPRMNLKWRRDLPFKSGTDIQFASDINSHRVVLRIRSGREWKLNWLLTYCCSSLSSAPLEVINGCRYKGCDIALWGFPSHGDV